MRRVTPVRLAPSLNNCWLCRANGFFLLGPAINRKYRHTTRGPPSSLCKPKSVRTFLPPVYRQFYTTVHFSSSHFCDQLSPLVLSVSSYPHLHAHLLYLTYRKPQFPKHTLPYCTVQLKSSCKSHKSNPPSKLCFKIQARLSRHLVYKRGRSKQKNGKPWNRRQSPWSPSILLRTLPPFL